MRTHVLEKMKGSKHVIGFSGISKLFGPKPINFRKIRGVGLLGPYEKVEIISGNRVVKSGNKTSWNQVRVNSDIEVNWGLGKKDEIRVKKVFYDRYTD